MNSFLTSYIDILDLNDKAELLIKSKAIVRLKEQAKTAIATMTDDELDELGIRFWEKVIQNLKA